MSNKSYKSNQKQIMTNITKGIEIAHHLAARKIINDAKMLTRVDSGDMRDSYDYQVSGTKKRKLTLGNTKDYFQFQELGTEYITAQNALTPSIENNKDKIKNIYGNQIANQIRKVK